MVDRRTSFVTPALWSAGRFAMIVDSGVDERREKASWFTTWFVTAGSISMDGVGVSSLATSGVMVATGGEEGISLVSLTEARAVVGVSLGPGKRFLMGDEGIEGVSVALSVSLEETL